MWVVLKLISLILFIYLFVCFRRQLIVNHTGLEISQIHQNKSALVVTCDQLQMVAVRLIAIEPSTQT